MESEKKFIINAKTCTLKYNNQNDQAIILDNETKYIIPIYQRPYSWTEDQIKKFISDIFTSFWGNDCISNEEPMFIGTMQLSEKNKEKSETKQEIIDGQQRISTFLILIKVLKNKFSNCKELENVNLNWLITRVNNGTQQIFLEEMITNELLSLENSLNPYLKNAFLIKELINEKVDNEDENLGLFEIDRFVKYLFSNIYFVVIETQAGLSKTLQIFNAINTTGLDLNGSDLFKIRMYEYLTDIKRKGEKSFEEISDLYNKIDKYNSDLGSAKSNINDILSIYQYILIAKYNLPVTLYSYGTDTFFERLFDSILNINQWEHFKNNIKDVELSIEDIDRIIEVRYDWQNHYYATAEDACAMHFIWWSRYSRYWKLIFVFLYKFDNNEDSFDKMFLFSRQLSKLYTIYSIKCQKAINHVHTFTYSVVNKIINGTYDEVIELINNEIGTIDNHKGWYNLETILNGNIIYNGKLKNILCRLSAMLEENYKTSNFEESEKIRVNLFEQEIDIEHIQSYNDSDGEKREDVWKEWGEEINSIGNLIILEQYINRSISNNPYPEKIIRYPESLYSIVGKHIEKHKEWNLDLCKKRKEYEINKIVNYLFEK
jgi:hypothetical protein